MDIITVGITKREASAILCQGIASSRRYIEREALITQSKLVRTCNRAGSMRRYRIIDWWRVHASLILNRRRFGPAAVWITSDSDFWDRPAKLRQFRHPKEANSVIPCWRLPEQTPLLSLLVAVAQLVLPRRFISYAPATHHPTSPSLMSIPSRHRSQPEMT